MLTKAALEGEIAWLALQVADLENEIEELEDRLDRLEEIRLKLSFALGLPETPQFGDWADILAIVERAQVIRAQILAVRRIT